MICNTKQRIGEQTLLNRLIEEFGSDNSVVVDIYKVLKDNNYSAYKNVIVDMVAEITGTVQEKMSAMEIAYKYIKDNKAIAGQYDPKTHVIQILPELSDNAVEYANDVVAALHIHLADTAKKSGMTTEKDINEFVEKTRISDAAKQIAINTLLAITEAAKNGTGSVMLHEYVHAGAYVYMQANPDGQLTKDIDTLYQTAMEKADQVDKQVESQYWKTNRDEFLAEAMSNTQLMKALSDIPYRGKMTLLDKLLDIVFNMLGIEPKSSIYNAVVAGFSAILEAQRSGSMDVGNAEVSSAIIEAAINCKE